MNTLFKFATSYNTAYSNCDTGTCNDTPRTYRFLIFSERSYSDIQRVDRRQWRARYNLN